MAEEPQAEFDYIIVGSGAGGGPLAARLAAAGKRVLVLEAGSNQTKLPATDPDFEVSLVPALHGVSTEHKPLSWRFFVDHYDTPPTGQDPKWHVGQSAEDTGIFYPRAAALGGCTIHNAMITIAGPDSDWDELAEFLKDDSWRANQMRAYFQRLEHNDYLDAPEKIPTRWLTRAWHNVRWLFGFDPDYTGGKHGFKGWLHTSVADVSLGLHDKQLIGMLKAAVKQAYYSGILRLGVWLRGILKGGLVRRLLMGQSHPILDPNHARTQADSPEGVMLIPLAVCGPKTTLEQNSQTPYVQRGRRSSPRELLLETQARFPENLTIWTECLATEVSFDDTANPPRAIGMKFLRGERLYHAHEDYNQSPGTRGEVRVKPGGEVILCGGAFNTPQLLMLSGIGNREHLEAETLKIRCRHHAPGVGGNLQDRYEVTVISKMRRKFDLLNGGKFALPDADLDPFLREWRAVGTGLYTSNGAVLGIFKRSRPDLDQPDLFIFGVPFPFEGYKVGYSKIGDIHDHFTWTILKGHTRNNGGTVLLRSADPLMRPRINFHYFNELVRTDQGAEDPDLLALLEGVKFVRGIAERTWKIIEKEDLPGDVAPPDDEAKVKDWIRRVAWGHHACGTCRMGPEGDDNAVLDPRFRVRGVQGLRVVDASIFPKIPGYFIVTNIYMASEKAADVILADAANNSILVPEYPRELRTKEAEAIETRRKKTPPDPAQPKEQLPSPVGKSGTWADDVTGLALSGGGIRSATLSLGILQALAKFHWLRRIDFLSTVSGGGYIGSFLGRLFDHQKEEPFTGAGGRPAPDRVEETLTDPATFELTWLRKHGNYIAPQGNGDNRLNIGIFLRNFLSAHFVVGLLLFAMFGLANAIRYSVFDPVTAGAGIFVMNKSDLPIGHLLQAAFGPFFSPWFVLFELLLLFLVVPKIIGYWIVSQDVQERFNGPALLLLFLAGTVLLFLGVYRGLTPEPLFLALALFTTFGHVEVAWQRGRIRELAVGIGNVETQRLRTRNYLTYDLGLVLALAGAALVFALIDTIGHGLQQWVVEMNVTYARAFAGIGAALVALMPIVRFAASLFLGEKKKTTGPPSTVARIVKTEIIAGLLAVVLFTLPLVFYSFAAHAVYQGGSAIIPGIAATVFALVLSLILTHPKAMTFVNRSSLAQTYAARLARAYLGASNPARQSPDGANITEVMAGDDVASMRDYQPHAAGGPLHLLNVTVNQTVDFNSQRGNRDRKGENLAVSCIGLSVGKNWHSAWADSLGEDTDDEPAKRPTRLEPLGYFPGTDHPLVDEAGQPTNGAEMLSLRQWMSISGAAVAPGRGAGTQLGTALLFGLANVRIGYWWDCGIPEASHDGFPRLSFLRRLLYLLPRIFSTQALLLDEWIANFPGPWEEFWYLSDGGFFENLGAYELIRRRVPRIIVCDGTADPVYEFDDFAELVRKVRIDFEASIDPFTEAELDKHVPADLRKLVGGLKDLKPPPFGDGSVPRFAAKHAALFWVHYQTGPPRKSVLLYLKATLTGDESADIATYRAAHPEFPHESTADQIFDEAQWESYRQLGEHLAEPLLQDQTWFWSIPLDNVPLSQQSDANTGGGQ